MYLIEATHRSNEWCFKVEGTTGASYNVCLMDGLCRCTCRDFYGRQLLCKHIYFIIGRVARLTDMMLDMTDDPTDFEMTEELDSALAMAVHRAREPTFKLSAPGSACVDVEECPICFETVGVAQEECIRCHHGFHTDCMRRWWANKKTSCPLCRAVFPAPESSPQTNYLAKFRFPPIIVDLTQDDD